MKLYTYWRSSCSWRVRIALNLKGLDYELHPVHLVKDGGEQHSEWYREINPQAKLPTLELDDGTHITQSMAIMMYLDRVHPAVSLLPTEPLLYAKIIQLAEIINAGIQPLQNLSVLQFLNKQDPSKELSMSWARGVIQKGLEDLESLVAESNTQFLLTDTPTIAECCLILNCTTPDDLAVISPKSQDFCRSNKRVKGWMLSTGTPRVFSLMLSEFSHHLEISLILERSSK